MSGSAGLQAAVMPVSQASHRTWCQSPKPLPSKARDHYLVVLDLTPQWCSSVGGGGRVGDSVGTCRRLEPCAICSLTEPQDLYSLDFWSVFHTQPIVLSSACIMSIKSPMPIKVHVSSNVNEHFDENSYAWSGVMGSFAGKPDTFACLASFRPNAALASFGLL